MPIIAQPGEIEIGAWTLGVKSGFFFAVLDDLIRSIEKGLVSIFGKKELPEIKTSNGFKISGFS